MIGFILAGMILGLGWDSPTSPSPINPKILAWVSQLGHKSFRVREQASKELIQTGLVAMPAVRAGAMSSNQEIAERCQTLLAVIPKADRNRKLDQLLKPTGEPAPKDLVGVERFLKITGDTLEARKLYAEMLRNHYEIIESLEYSPDKTSELFAVHVEKLLTHAANTGREFFFS